MFVLIDPRQPHAVLGYDTLCATALAQGEVPAVLRKHLPRYPLVSATWPDCRQASRALSNTCTKLRQSW